MSIKQNNEQGGETLERKNKKIISSSIFAMVIVLLMVCNLPVLFASQTTPASPEQVMTSFHNQVIADRNKVLHDMQEKQLLSQGKLAMQQVEPLISDYGYTVDSLYSYGASGGGQYSNPSGIVGSANNNFASLKADSDGETVEIVGYTNHWFLNDIRVRMCYQYPDAYEWSNYLGLWVSPDGTTWTYITACQANSQDPITIGFGHGSSSYHYVGVAVDSIAGYGMKEWVKVDDISFQTELSY